MTIAHVGKLSRETGGEYRVRRSLQCTESSVAALIKSANECGHGPVKHQSPNRQLLYLKLHFCAIVMVQRKDLFYKIT